MPPRNHMELYRGIYAVDSGKQSSSAVNSSSADFNSFFAQGNLDTAYSVITVVRMFFQYISYRCIFTTYNPLQKKPLAFASGFFNEVAMKG